MADQTQPNNRRYKGVYSKSFLTRVYDHYVLGFNMNYVWGCSTKKVLLPFFSDNFSQQHMDIGVATGFFLIQILSDSFSLESLYLVDDFFIETLLISSKR